MQLLKKCGDQERSFQKFKRRQKWKCSILIEEIRFAKLVKFCKERASCTEILSNVKLNSGLIYCDFLIILPVDLLNPIQ